jgi:hypothetical protein
MGNRRFVGKAARGIIHGEMKRFFKEVVWFFGVLFGNKKALDRPLHDLRGRESTIEDYIGP